MLTSSVGCVHLSPVHDPFVRLCRVVLTYFVLNHWIDAVIKPIQVNTMCT